VDFDVPIDTSSVTRGSFHVLGHWSGVVEGSFRFEAGNTRVTFFPSRDLSAGEMVLCNVARTVRSAAGDTMLRGHAWTFWVRTVPGSMQLTETSRIPIRSVSTVPIQSYGAYGGDFNGDRALDLAIPNEISNDVRLFLNDGRGGYGPFTIHPIPGGSRPSPNEGADFNGDGRLDYVVGNTGNDLLALFTGNGAGGFSQVTTHTAAASVRGVALLDLEGDGDIDVATANRTASNLSLFRNDGRGVLSTAQPVEANCSQETALAAADMNGDGALDLVVGAYGSSEIAVLLNDGTGGFTFSQKRSARGRPWMIAVGDVNGDGKADVVSANSTANNAAVLMGDGTGRLDSAAVYSTGGFPLAIDVGDIDGDGDLDLVTSNFSGVSWSVFENPGNGLFGNRRTLPASGAGSCATLYDPDNDGDLDMAGIDEIDDLLFLFRNAPPSAVGQGTDVPAGPRLEQNYPNPFNPSTTIRFTLLHPGFVRLVLYDVLGRAVRTVLEGSMEGGSHEVAFDAAGLASGVYLYELQTPGFRDTRMMVLAR
jgi:hypothetical protein